MGGLLHTLSLDLFSMVPVGFSHRPALRVPLFTYWLIPIRSVPRSSFLGLGRVGIFAFRRKRGLHEGWAR